MIESDCEFPVAGYHVLIHKLNASTWLPVSRPRPAPTVGLAFQVLLRAFGCFSLARCWPSALDLLGP